MTTLNYIEDIQIDENALDIETLNQPTLSKKYGTALANKKEEVNKLKLKIELQKTKIKEVYAKLFLGCNFLDFLEVFGKSKSPTNDEKESYIITHQEYKDEQDELFKLKEDLLSLERDYDDLEDATKQIQHTKKDSLSFLIQLFMGQYWAGPSVPRNLKDEVDKYNTRIAETLNRRN